MNNKNIDPTEQSRMGESVLITARLEFQTTRLPDPVRWVSAFYRGVLVGCSTLAVCSCTPKVTTPPASTMAPARQATLPVATLNTGATIAGIKNLHVVHPFLLRGAQPQTPDAVRSLQRAGIHTIIDLRIMPKHVKQERQLAQSLGMRYINLPMSGDPPTNRQVDAFLSTVADPAARPVFVHCEHGADRTGTLVGIYRERVEGWKFQPTYAEMLHYGFNPHWTKLTQTVKQYAP